jgi:hypothetical protein
VATRACSSFGSTPRTTRWAHRAGAAAGALAEQHMFLSTVADILAPVLRQAAYAQRLESEVIERTRQIDRERRITSGSSTRSRSACTSSIATIASRCGTGSARRGCRESRATTRSGRTIFEVLHRQPATVLRREFDDVFATGRCRSSRWSPVRRESCAPFRISKIPMRLDDGP